MTKPAGSTVGIREGSLTRKNRKKIEKQPPLANGQRGLLFCFSAYQVTYSSQNRVSITAA